MGSGVIGDHLVLPERRRAHPGWSNGTLMSTVWPGVPMCTSQVVASTVPPRSAHGDSAFATGTANAVATSASAVAMQARALMPEML